MLPQTTDNPGADPRHPFDAFLDGCPAGDPLFERQVLAYQLQHATGMRQEEAEEVVDEYLARRGPRPPAKPVPARDGIMAFVALAIGLMLLIGVPYLAYRVLATPPPGPAPAGPNVWRYAVYGWTVLLSAALLWPVVKGRSRQHLHFFRKVTPAVVAQNVLVLVAVVVVGGALGEAFPFLDRSWLYLIPGNGGEAVNISVVPMTVRFIGPAFLLLFALNVPAMALGEEKSYRSGTKDWRDGWKRSVRFGLVHCLVGIPLHWGLALTVGGLWFTHQYFRGGVERSTTHHVAYNLIVLAIIGLAMFFAPEWL